jgi:hypothetical protein
VLSIACTSYTPISNRDEYGAEVMYKDDEDLQRILTTEWNRPLLPNKPPWRIFALRKQTDGSSSNSFQEENPQAASPTCDPQHVEEETTIVLKCHHGLGDGVSICYAFYPTFLDKDQGCVKKMVTSLVHEHQEKASNGGAQQGRACDGDVAHSKAAHQTSLRVSTLLHIAIYVASFLVVPFAYAR